MGLIGSVVMAQSSCELQKSVVNKMTQRAICMDAAEAFIGNNTSIDKQCWRDVATSIGLNKAACTQLIPTLLNETCSY